MFFNPTLFYCHREECEARRGDLNCHPDKVLRVLKPSGMLVIISGEYKGGKFDERNAPWVEYGNMTYLTLEEHRTLLEHTGYVDVTIHEDYQRGWMCITGSKPA